MWHAVSLFMVLCVTLIKNILLFHRPGVQVQEMEIYVNTSNISKNKKIYLQVMD